MTTKVYFVRHAKVDYSIRDDHSRPLTDEGRVDVELVTNALLDKQISSMYSSPYLRAIHTVQDFANRVGLEITTVHEFRERKIHEWVEDFEGFSRKQWADFSFKIADGESLEEVQKRNVTALFDVVRRHEGESIVIGTHGTALSTILNYFDPTFAIEQFKKLAMPDIYMLEFEGEEFIGMKKILLK